MSPMMMLFARADRTALPQGRSDRAVPLPETLLAQIAAEIRSHGGATHPAAADQIAASWPAHGPGSDQAVTACRAALALRRVIRLAGSAAAPKDRLQARLAIEWNAAADFLIAAERFDLADACFGAEIAIGERARVLAGEKIHAREIDLAAVGGRRTDRIYELLGTADRGVAPSWLSLYDAGLAAYRSRDFAGALGFFRMVLALRPWDRPSQSMADRCRQMLAAESCA